jgi:hypothetical protein
MENLKIKKIFETKIAKNFNEKKKTYFLFLSIFIFSINKMCAFILKNTARILTEDKKSDKNSMRHCFYWNYYLNLFKK